jgi:hypothetical protein
MAHPIRQRPHAWLLRSSVTTADVLSVAVPTVVTSSTVQAAEGGGEIGAVDGGVALAQALAQLVASFAH